MEQKKERVGVPWKREIGLILTQKKKREREERAFAYNVRTVDNTLKHTYSYKKTVI